MTAVADPTGLPRSPGGRGSLFRGARAGPLERVPLTATPEVPAGLRLTSNRDTMETTPMWLQTTTRLVIIAAALAAGPATAAADARAGRGRMHGAPATTGVDDWNDAHTFALRFHGVDRDGVSLVWGGTLPGARGGTITLTLTPLSSAAASAEPVWPVRARWVVAAPDGTDRRTADLDGIVDWRDRRVHLQGRVAAGADAGLQVVVSATLRDLDASGTFSLFQSIAER